MGGAVAFAAKALTTPAEEQKAVVADVASRLGVTPAKLTDAVTQALLDRVDAAVAAGRITADQGAQLKARIKAGGARLFGGPLGGPGGPMGGGPGGPGDGHRGGPRGGGLGTAAKALGLTVDALHAQLESGKSLADVAKAQGKSVADLKAALVAALQGQVDAAVKAGRITADQGAQIVTRETGELDALIARKGDGHRGFGGPPPGAPAPDGGFGSGGAALPTGPTGA
jgi:hypothetical protein